MQKAGETDITSILTPTDVLMLLRMPSPITPEKGVMHQHLQKDVSPRWGSYFTPLGEGELLGLHGAPTVLLEAGSVETSYTWNGTRTPETGRKRGPWSGIFRPQPFSSRLTVLPPPPTSSARIIRSHVDIEGSGPECNSDRRETASHTSSY